MIGTSGPSISTTALSTPRPRSAASTCSAVETQRAGSSSPSTVANSVAVTAAHVGADFALADGPRRPVRMKTMPVPASAGCSVSVTGKPEWTPMPDNAARSRKRGLPAGFHAPVPQLARRSPACRRHPVHHAAQLVAFSAIGMAEQACGPDRPALPLSPAKPLVALTSLTAGRRNRPTHAFLPTVTVDPAAIVPAATFRQSTALPHRPDGALRHHAATAGMRQAFENST